jgi:arylsulfatase
VVAELRKAYDAWWEKTLPLMVNEEVVGPKVNPYKELFWKKYGKEDNGKSKRSE